MSNTHKRKKGIRNTNVKGESSGKNDFWKWYVH